MTTQTAPPELRPLSEVQPVVLDGVRVFRNVVAHGDDLLHLGSVDNTRWIECDLSGTVWPKAPREVTLVDTDLRNSVWDLDGAENIKIFGTRRIRVSLTESAEGPDVVALNLDDILARVDGMRIDGSTVGLAMIRVASAPDSKRTSDDEAAALADTSGDLTGRTAPKLLTDGRTHDPECECRICGHARLVAAGDLSHLTIAGSHDNTVIRQSYLPDFHAVGVKAEDMGIPDNCMPRARFDFARVVRLTMAKTIAPFVSFIKAVTNRANFQKAVLTFAKVTGWVAHGAFFEEADLRGIRDGTKAELNGSHFMDSRRDGTTFGAVPDADFGPAGPGEGNKRRSMRKNAAAAQRREGSLG